jgi:hypothetical protein
MPNLQGYYQTDDLTQAQKEAESAGTTAANYQSAAHLLPQKLREAVMAKVGYNKDIIDAQSKAQADYFAQPSKSRAKYADPTSENYIFNPFQAEALVSEERAQAYQPFASLTDVLAQRLGTLSDIINAGTQSFNADVSAKQGAASLAEQKYNRLMEMADKLSDAAYREESLRQSGSGGGTGIAGVTKADQLTAETWEDLLYDGDGNMRNEYDIWKEINANQNAYAMKGIDVQKLWAMHSAYATSTRPKETAKEPTWWDRTFGGKKTTTSNVDLSKIDWSKVDTSRLKNLDNTLGLGGTSASSGTLR